MTDFIEGLERDLVAAARRQAAGETPLPVRPRGDRRRWRWSGRTLAVALVLGTGTATATAAATVAVLRGSVIPAPAARDVPREQTPVPSTARVSALRVADPHRGVPPWTLRIARSDTGYLCSTVGQVRGGAFGLVGLDGRFRTLAAGVTDSCGQEQRTGASLVGARVFAGRRPADVRTVVSGIAGPRLRTVVLATATGRRAVAHRPDGAFAAVERGYPEDLGLDVVLTFADGHRERHALGRDPSVVLDPAGGPAWKPERYSVAGDARDCVTFGAARAAPGRPQAPAACGALRRSGADGRQGVFFAVRRLTSRTVRPPAERQLRSGDWRGDPPRTAIWGAFGDDVRSVTVRGLPGRRGPVQVALRGGVILGVFPGDVDPGALRVVVERKDGGHDTYRGDTHLVRHAVPDPASRSAPRPPGAKPARPMATVPPAGAGASARPGPSARPGTSARPGASGRPGRSGRPGPSGRPARPATTTPAAPAAPNTTKSDGGRR